MKNYNRSVAFFLCALVCFALQAKDYVVSSPNGHLKAMVSDNARVEWTITHEGVTVHREATDFKHVSRIVAPTEKISVHLAPAGGWTARFSQSQNVQNLESAGIDTFITANGTNVFVHCIKHGSLSINIGDKWIYVDPVTDKVPPVTDYTTMPKADYILVTHEHADHLDAKAIEQLTTDETMLIVNPKSCEILGGKGDVMKNGDNKEMGAWTVTAVPAYNTSADKQQFHPKGRDNGYILTIEGLRIYIAGDTEPISEMEDIKDIDVAFLPCNLPFTMTPEQLTEAAKVIRPKVLFPYHYGKTDIQQVVKLLEGSCIDVRIRQYQ